MKSVIVALPLLLSLSVFAQKKDTVLITAGNNRLQSYLLKDYTASYDFYSLRNGAETLVGTLDDQFQILPSRKALRICKIKFGENSILDSGLCELKGLTPIYHRSIQTRKSMILDFKDGNVAGKVIMKNDTENKIDNVNYRTGAPIFDSFYEDIIAKALDPKTKGIFRFPEYIYEKGGTVWSIGEVLKSERPSETIIRFHELNTKKEVVRTTTFVIDSTTRDILRREYALGANKIIMKKKA